VAAEELASTGAPFSLLPIIHPAWFDQVSVITVRSIAAEICGQQPLLTSGNGFPDTDPSPRRDD